MHNKVLKLKESGAPWGRLPQGLVRESQVRPYVLMAVENVDMVTPLG